MGCGLKGQYNSAQGIVLGGTTRNAALGKGCSRKTVRVDSMSKVNNSFRTELSDIIFGKHKVISLVRNKIFSFMNVVTRTILMPIFQPRAPPEASGLPWARINWPFRLMDCLFIIITVSERYVYSSYA